MGRVQQKKAQLWRERIAAAESFPGSIEAYCRQEGIQSSSFYSWRRRLATEDTKSQSAFVPALIATTRSVRSEIEQEARLPDPKWLGEMLASLIRGLT